LAGIVDSTARFSVVPARLARRRLATFVLVADTLPLLVEQSLLIVAVITAASHDDECEHRENDCNRSSDAASTPRSKLGPIRPAVSNDVTHGAPPLGGAKTSRRPQPWRIPFLAATVLEHYSKLQRRRDHARCQRQRNDDVAEV
jgi:hypothetical protein